MLLKTNGGPPPDDERAVRNALARLTAQAGWEVADLLGRKGALAARDLLRGRAAEFAGSYLAREYLLAILLDGAATDLERGDAPACSSSGLLAVRAIGEAQERAVREVADQNGVAASVQSLVFAAEQVSRRLSDVDAVLALQDEAALNARYWRDQRLPAEIAQRAVMLASAAPLQRAAATRKVRWRQGLFPGL